MSPERRALLELWLRAHGRDGQPARPPGGPSTAPLSFAQERLWFLDRLAPGTPLYKMYAALEFRLAVDLGALEATLNEVRRRHDVLRTTFRSDGGRPVQVISPHRPQPLEVHDLRPLDEAARATEVSRHRREEAETPFDLRTGPLLRHRLLRLADEHALLLLSMHHIVSDGWSMDVLYREIQVLYDSFVTGRPSSLPELPVQYSDFVRWQREHLSGEMLSTLIGYWRAQLEGLPPLLELPTDRPRPPVQDFRGATLTFAIPWPERDALLALGQQEGATLFMTLLAAFATLLGRYADSTDVVIGAPIANRTRSELEGLIGFFVNTLVLRVRLFGDPTFRELVSRVKQTTLDAYAHQDLPFEKLVAELQPVRSLANNPLSQVMFVLQNTPASQAVGEAPDLETDAVPGVAKFDLTLSLTDGEQGLWGAVEYATALFDTARIRRLVRHLTQLLREVAVHPQARLSQLRVLGEDEVAAWRADLTGPKVPFPEERVAHALLEEAARRQPDAPAIEAAGRVLSYRALNGAANRLARRLRAAGVGPEVRVALALPRGTEAVVALFAILKAGGAFVPLDPGLPESRKAQIVQGAHVSHAVVRGASGRALRELGVQVIDLETMPETGTVSSDADLGPTAEARNLAYIIHTSGSTGTPKGVLIEHRGLSNMVEAQCRRLGDVGGIRVLQVASLSFDAAVLEILHAARLGGCLVIPPAEAVLAGPELARFLAEKAIQLAVLPPSVLAGLPPLELPALHTILVGGEACTRDLVSRWAPGRRFINAYGPTEVTVWVTAAECGPQDPPTIGLPMPNAVVRLLDRAGRPVPVGIPGEIYVGGVGLARGYSGRPGWTAERFLPDPFSSEPGARMYRTGDLAWRGEDGQLVFLGRADEQVKVRGFRVEPGEVESALRQHPAVAQAAVVAEREAGPWPETLVAFWTARPGVSPLPTSAELQGFVRARLPEASVPSWVEALAEMPLLPSGKVDRRALPRPRRGGQEEGRVAPRSETEKKLTAIVADVLGVQEVGAFDNFFELGGHSLLATRVVARVQEVFSGVEVPLRRFFEGPTVAALAEAVESPRPAGEALPASPLLPLSREAYRVKLGVPGGGAEAPHARAPHGAPA